MSIHWGEKMEGACTCRSKIAACEVNEKDDADQIQGQLFIDNFGAEEAAKCFQIIACWDSIQL